MPLALLAGLVLGMLSRLEETTSGLSFGVSSNGAWLALPFALGALAARGARRADVRPIDVPTTRRSDAGATEGGDGVRPVDVLSGRRSGARAAARGGAALGAVAATAGNVGYYAWVAATEPGRALASVAGPVEEWLALGLGGGGTFGAAGAVAASAAPPARAVAVLLLAGVLVVDGSQALRGGAATDAVGLLAGLALPAMVSVPPRWRGAGMLAACAVLAVALTGALDPLSP